MSMSILRINVKWMNVTLKSVPKNCIHSLSEKERLTQVRELLLNDFQRSGKSLTNQNYICNMHIINEEGYAIFLYRCCYLVQGEGMICDNQVKGFWINILFAFITCIKILIVLYSPIFLPSFFYGRRFNAARYVYHCPNDIPKKMKIVKTRRPDLFRSRNMPIGFHKLADMKYFQIMLQMMPAEKVYLITFDKILLTINSYKLISKDVIPIGVLEVLFENIFRCRLKYLPTFKSCCEGNIFGKLYPRCTEITWYQCLRQFANLILLIIAALPWIVRMIIYYTYEEPVLKLRRTIAKRMNLMTRYEGSITSYLSPHHAVFILIYIKVVFGVLFYTFAKRKMKDQFKYVLMRNYIERQTEVRVRVYSWITQLIIRPFKRYGVLGVLVAIPYCAFILPFKVGPVIAFYVFPFVNLNVRLFIILLPKTISQKFDAKTEKMIENIHSLMHHTFLKESNITYQRMFSFIIVFVSVMSFWSLTFLLMECISFYVEMLVYTITGIIVNAEHMMRYITVVFFVYMYVRDTFSAVDKVYRNYYNIIFEFLLSQKKLNVLETARLHENAQENTVFRVERPSISETRFPYAQIQVKDRHLYWNTSGFLIFLDIRDTPYSPVNFFHRSITLNCHGCPGELRIQMLKAFITFGKMVLFLLFVAIIVMAFGDAYDVSATNQLLVTVIGGFVPFVFKNFLSQPVGDCTLNTDSIQFITEFDQAVNTFQQMWPVADIVINMYEPYRSKKTKHLENLPRKNPSMAYSSVESCDEERTISDSGVENSLLELSHEDVQKVDLIIDITNTDALLWNAGSVSTMSNGTTSSNLNYKKSDNIFDL